MAGFYHYAKCEKAELLERGQFRRSKLEELGLAEVLADCVDCPDHAVVSETPHSGPDGGGGLVIYPKCGRVDAPPRWGYSPEHQTWRKIGDGRRWLGWDNDLQPTPPELERRQVFRDYRFTDRGGRDWSLPCARSPRPMRSSLPVDYGFGENGCLTRKISADFEDLWILSGQVLDHANGVTDRTEQWLVEAALKCLSVNYRVGHAEVNALRDMGLAVLTERTVFGILSSLVDHDLEQEAEETLAKKNAEGMRPKNTNGQCPRASASASNGPAGDCRTTHQPAAP